MRNLSIQGGEIKRRNAFGRFPNTGFIYSTEYMISIIDNPIRFNTGIEMSLTVICIDLLLKQSKDRRKVLTNSLGSTMLAGNDKTKLGWILV